MDSTSVQYCPFTINIPIMDVKRFKTIAKAMDWRVAPVSERKPRAKRLTAMDEAVEDIRQGRVYHADSVEDMFKQILG